MKLIATFVWIVTVLTSSAATSISGKVVSVADGDTITVLDGDNRQTKIRLHGIDCPESAQPFGTTAKQFTSGKAFGKNVSVIVKDRDRYGRTVGVVMVGKENVNLALVRAGLAWWYRQYAPDDKTLQEAEQTARKAKLGLWSQPNAIAPWDWRRGKRAGSGSTSTTRAEIAGHWITSSSNKRHNSACRYFKTSTGRLGKKTEGIACKICGG